MYHRKAFLLLRGEQIGVPHAYARIIEEQEAANRQTYRAGMAGAADATGARGPADLDAGHDVILDAVVVADGLDAGAVLRIRKGSTPEPEHRTLYELLGVPLEVMRPRRNWVDPDRKCSD